AAGITAGRVEGETDDRLAVAHDISDDRQDRGRHLGKIEARIPHVRLERDRAFADVDDTHRGFIPVDSCYSALRKVDGPVPHALRSCRRRGAVGTLVFQQVARLAGKGAKDVTEKAMTFAEQNITSAFEFAQELMRARDIQDVLRLQADYIKRQMQALTEQARELGESTSKAAKDATTPKR